MSSGQEISIGVSFRSTTGKPSLHEPIVAYARSNQLKKKRAGSIIGLMNKVRRKADNLAQGIRDHVSLGPGVSETVKGKLKLGTRILQAGGIERVFNKSFSNEEGERLVKAFQCHLSTTVGPIPGLLFISTKKIAFLSDRPLVMCSTKGNIARIPYKVLIPLGRIKGVNPSVNAEKPNQKYIHVATIDDFEFWFMGFVSYQRSFKNLTRVLISNSQVSFLQ